MTFREFHNMMRVLLNIDGDTFMGMGFNADEWHSFRGNPHMWFIRASTFDAERIWQYMCKYTGRKP